MSGRSQGGTAKFPLSETAPHQHRIHGSCRDSLCLYRAATEPCIKFPDTYSETVRSPPKVTRSSVCRGFFMRRPSSLISSDHSTKLTFRLDRFTAVRSHSQNHTICYPLLLFGSGLHDSDASQADGPGAIETFQKARCWRAPSEAFKKMMRTGRLEPA